MIEKLTPEQEAYIPVFRQKYLDKFYKNNDVSDEVYKEKYAQIYTKMLGIKKPKQIFVTESPVATLLLFEALRSNLGSNLEENLKENLGSNLKANLWENLWENLRLNLEENLGENLGLNLRANLRANLWENLGLNLGSNLRANLCENLEANLEENLRAISNYGDSIDLSWVGNYIFAVEMFDFVPEELSDKLKLYDSIIGEAPSIFNIFYEDFAIISRAPIEVFRDGEGKLHNDDGGMAVRFKDGWGIYVINGVNFDEKLYMSIVKRTITAEEVARLENTEQRMIALKYLSPEEFIKGSKATQVGLTTTKGNTLYKGSFDEVGTVWFLRFKCPTTGREYIEFTNPEEFAEDLKRINGGDVDIYNPDVLQAYSFVFETGGKTEHLSLIDYLSMEVEA